MPDEAVGSVGGRCPAAAPEPTPCGGDAVSSPLTDGAYSTPSA